jgi:hypothetical protein
MKDMTREETRTSLDAPDSRQGVRVLFLCGRVGCEVRSKERKNRLAGVRRRRQATGPRSHRCLGEEGSACKETHGEGTVRDRVCDSSSDGRPATTRRGYRRATPSQQPSNGKE